MKNNKRIYIIALILLLPGVSLATWATLHYRQNRPVVKKIRPADTLFKNHVYDKALVARLASVCKKYDTLKANYTITGIISLVDKADTLVKVNNIPFTYCKQGKSFYYRMGKNEVMNSDGIYLAMDNQAKTIIVSKQKGIEEPQTSKMLGSITEALRSEAYNLTSQTNGGKQTLSLINEHHISCKQYSVSFDTLTMGISRIYVRLTNVNQPLRTDNEKILDLHIDEWDGKTDIKKYALPESVVRQYGKGWAAREAYKGYKLINL